VADLHSSLNAIDLARTIRCHARALDEIANAVEAGIPVPEAGGARTENMDRLPGAYAVTQALHDQASAAFRALPLAAKKDRLVAATVTAPALAVLRRLEWRGNANQGAVAQWCPVCLGVQPSHGHGCPLADVLRAAEGLVP